MNLTKNSRLIALLAFLIAVSYCSTNSDGQVKHFTNLFDDMIREQLVSSPSKQSTKIYIDGDKMMRGEVVQAIDVVDEQQPNKETQKPLVERVSLPQHPLVWDHPAVVKIDQPFKTASILEKLFKDIVWHAFVDRYGGDPKMKDLLAKIRPQVQKNHLFTA